MTDTVPLFNPNDRLAGRDGGPYMDLEQAKLAEQRRAEVEGREPDLDNPPAFAGIPLNTAGQQALTVGVAGIASQESRNFTDDDVTFAGAVDSDKNLLQPFSEREQIVEDDVSGPVFGVTDLNPAAKPTGPHAEGGPKENEGKAAADAVVGNTADKVNTNTTKARTRTRKRATTAEKTAAKSKSNK